jgi:hypothetical protein
MKPRLCIAIIAFGVIGSLFVAYCNGADEATNPAISSPFAGKGLIVTTKDRGLPGAYLENAEVRKLNGRDFLVGNIVAVSDRWVPVGGKTEWIALDSVFQIYEFNSSTELKDVNAIIIEQNKALQQKTQN